MQPKKVIQHMLYKGRVRVYIGTFLPGVQLPAQFMNAGILPLNLSLRFDGPMSLNDDGISVELSFNKEPFLCFLPWPAIFAASDKDGETVQFTPTGRSVHTDPDRQHLKQLFYGHKSGSLFAKDYQPPAKEQKLTVITNENLEELTTPRTGHLRLVN